MKDGMDGFRLQHLERTEIAKEGVLVIIIIQWKSIMIKKTLQFLNRIYNKHTKKHNGSLLQLSLTTNHHHIPAVSFLVLVLRSQQWHLQALCCLLQVMLQ
jgi:hypothetical protein